MDPVKPRISVVVPALNEEPRIEGAVQSAISVLEGRCSDWEILLFNDGSTDRTGEIMDRLAAGNPRLKVTHNPKSRNLGGVYKQAVEQARFDYLFMVPGDNENPVHALLAPLDAIGRADIIVPYPTNQGERPFHRQVGSKGYTAIMNLLFGLRLEYFNGTVIHRTDLLRSIDIETDSFAYQAEILIKLLRRGATFEEVGIRIEAKPGERRSNALRWKNLRAVGHSMLTLFVAIRLTGESRVRGVA